MHIELNEQSLLTQLGYPITETTLKQIQTILSHTTNFQKFSKHLLALEDKIRHMNALIAMSNNQPYLKIKYEGHSPEILEEFEKSVLEWSHKYHITLQKVPNKSVYYILGVL